LFGISEGAIPYAIANPLRTIPAFMVGAAVGGGMMMALDLETKMFSGLVALPFTDRWFLFALSILVGVLVSVGLLYILKKEPTPEEEDEISDILDIM
ncbi:MAG TPA: PTS system, fructose subfamily, IIC subunit, partial [Clostridiaceae bacterium]|nr:PTS system, fructose subfamily, IIC subunit [Clostridiaceae bacterium]